MQPITTMCTIIPFTIQRLCELLTDPRRNYTGTDKFLRGVEKNVMVVSCVYPTSEKNNSNSLNRMNGVMFPGNSPGYSERSNINGPGTPRPVNRPKVSLSAPMTTNGLPDSPENQEAGLPQAEEKVSSESPASEPESVQSSTVKNKHPEEDPVDVEGREVKRLKFDKEVESEETSTQSGSSETCSAMVEETETTTSPLQDKEKENICERQHCKEEEEEEEEESLMTSGETVPERKEQDKDSASLTVKEDISEENNQMEQSEQTRAEKDLPSEDSENSGSVGSRADCSETEDLGSYASETPETASETPMENSDETTEAAEEPMEQD
ncbi:UNVERIFIED_CONTAM: hypothetical protein K2H54_056453 [Gekko kuhli]